MPARAKVLREAAVMEVLKSLKKMGAHKEEGFAEKG